MKSFRIYRRPDQEPRAVKQGWSWPAFIFGPLWALYRRLWVPAIGAPVVFFSIGALIDLVHGHDKTKDMFMYGVLVVVGAAFGACGNRWVERGLRSRGHEFKEMVEAADAGDALAVFSEMQSEKPDNPSSPG